MKKAYEETKLEIVAIEDVITSSPALEESDKVPFEIPTIPGA